MKHSRKRNRLLALVVLLGVLFGSSLASADDWKLTGSGLRVKTIASAEFAVYDIAHYVKGSVAQRTKQSVIDADTSKRFVWTMRREVGHDTMRATLRQAFTANGYSDANKVGLFLGAFQSALKENQWVTIDYDTDKKETTLRIEGSSAVTIHGIDFMKAVWSIWFGRIDQPKLGDQLIAKLP